MASAESLTFVLRAYVAMYRRAGITPISCRICVNPDAVTYSIVHPEIPRHNVAGWLTDSTSEGRRARSCATTIEPTWSADMPTFAFEATLRVSIFAGLIQRPSSVTDAEGIGSGFQSFGTMITFADAAVAAGEGEAVGVGTDTGGACATSAVMRNTCAKNIRI